jgi:hypothetical protein
MKKVAILPLPPFELDTNLNLKKNALMFEKLFVKKDFIEFHQSAGDIYFVDEPNVDLELVRRNLADIDYLLKAGIIEPYEPIVIGNYKAKTEQEIQIYNEQILALSNADMLEPKTQDDAFVINVNKLYSNPIIDILTRLDTVQFMSQYKDVYPILFSKHSFQNQNTNTRRKAVVEFIIDKIPEPSDTTSWEQIIEFRQDDDLQKKYYNLIGWINKVAANTSYDEVAMIDEYNELLSEYKKAFQLHQKISLTTRIALIVKSGIEVFTQPTPQSVPSLINNFFSLHQRHFELLESEGKIVGKEIAYIYQIEQKMK